MVGSVVGASRHPAVAVRPRADGRARPSLSDDPLLSGALAGGRSLAGPTPRADAPVRVPASPGSDAVTDRLAALWERFWFRPVDDRGLVVTRIVSAATALWLVL